MLKLFLFLTIITWNKQYKYQQIMQQQYYSYERYFKLVYKETGLVDFFILLISILFFYLNIEILQQVFCVFVILLHFPRRKKSILPLKFTKRVIRTYVFNYLFLLLIAFLEWKLHFDLKDLD